MGLVIAFLVGALPIVILMGLESTPANGPQEQSADDGNLLESLTIAQNPFKVDLSKESNASSAAVTRGENIFADMSLNERQKAVWQKLLTQAKQQTDIKSWNDAVLALMSNLVERLNLTDLQRVEISQILNYTENSLAKLQAAVSDDDRAKVAGKRLSILEEAYVGLMNILTDAQQSELERLVQEPPASGPTP